MGGGGAGREGQTAAQEWQSPTPWKIPHEEHTVMWTWYQELPRPWRDTGSGDSGAPASFLSLQTIPETLEMPALLSMLSDVFSLLPRAPGEHGF